MAAAIVVGLIIFVALFLICFFLYVCKIIRDGNILTRLANGSGYMIVIGLGMCKNLMYTREIPDKYQQDQLQAMFVNERLSLCSYRVEGMTKTEQMIVMTFANLRLQGQKVQLLDENGNKVALVRNGMLHEDDIKDDIDAQIEAR